MPTTPNNGFPYPVSTDFVKDGAEDIQALADSVDTKLGSGLLAWQSWAPTLSGGWLNGNGTWNAKYVQIGKTVIANGFFTVGSTTTKGTGMTISLPVTGINRFQINGTGFAGVTSGSGLTLIHVYPAATDGITIFANNAASTFLSSGSVTTAAPFTWVTNSILTFTVTYEAA